MPLVRELGAAADFASGRTAAVAARPRTEQVAGLAWLPLGGLAVGATAALAAAVVATVAGRVPAAIAGALVLRAAHWSGWRRGLLIGAVEAAAATALAPGGRPVAFLVAPMLARWACVVQCYGGMPVAGATGMAALAGRARFREFGIASVTALGVLLVSLDAVGLVVGVASALVTVAVRSHAYARRQGLDDPAMNATSALVEMSALVLLASIGSLLGVR